MQRSSILFSFILLIVFSVLCSTAAVQGEEQISEADIITIKVVSDPAGASVVVNRVIRGKTPIDLRLEKGKHLIRVSMDQKWQPFIEEREFTKDETLEVKLTPISSFSFERGKTAFEQGKFQEARTQLMQAVSSEGRVIPEGFFYLALIERKNNNNKTMEEYFKKYINYNPPSGPLVKLYPDISTTAVNYGVQISHYLLGDLYRESYKWSEAATAYKLSIPQYNSYLDKSVKPEFAVIRQLRDKANKTPDDYRTLIQLGYLYELKGMLFQSAMAYRDGAKALYSQSIEFMKDYGSIMDW